MASPNAVASVDTAVGGEKRSLRYHKNKGLEDESDDEALLEEEERKYTNMFSTTKLDEMLNGTKMMSRFRKWKARGYNTYNLLAVTQKDKYTWIRQKYRDFLYHN
ncbi:hypothetical protein DVH05_014581 [Phytophthora capsici]|nr:hypothetical protein DVH05_014581 [Phytophthora capsici]